MEKTTHSSKKILCFGELLLRMSPHMQGEWIQQHHMPTYVGGAELNVATALAKWEIPVKYVSAIPDHSLSYDLLSYLGGKNIDMSSMLLSGNRIGLYFLPQGSDLKNAGVIYDRAYSSFSELQPGDLPWGEILEDVCWVHFSAISPALNENVTAVCLELLQVASQKDIPISIDLNYRAKLWKYGKNPAGVMSELLPYCDLVMGNIWAAEKLLGIPLDNALIQHNVKESYLEHAYLTSKAIQRAYPKVKKVANTFRFDASENDILYYATFCTPEEWRVSKEFKAQGIKDKIGSGDCFMAGLLYGLSHSFDLDKVLQFAASAAVGKMYETSDATDQTVASILLTEALFTRQHA